VSELQKKGKRGGRGSFDWRTEEEKKNIYIKMMKEYGACLQMDGTWPNCIFQWVDMPHELKKCELKLIGQEKVHAPLVYARSKVIFNVANSPVI
jgi:hypothetical protein